MPPVASAIPRGGTSSHCPTGDRHGASDVQHGINDGIGTLGDTLRDGAIGKHAGNSVDRDDGNNPKWHAGACCSLFSCAAIIGDSGATVEPVRATVAPTPNRVPEPKANLGA